MPARGRNSDTFLVWGTGVYPPEPWINCPDAPDKMLPQRVRDPRGGLLAGCWCILVFAEWRIVNTVVKAHKEICIDFRYVEAGDRLAFTNAEHAKDTYEEATTPSGRSSVVRSHYVFDEVTGEFVPEELADEFAASKGRSKKQKRPKFKGLQPKNGYPTPITFVLPSKADTTS